MILWALSSKWARQMALYWPSCNSAFLLLLATSYLDCQVIDLLKYSKCIGRVENWPVWEWLHFVSEGRSSGCQKLHFVLVVVTSHFSKSASIAGRCFRSLWGYIFIYRVDFYIDAKNGKQFPYGWTNSYLETQYTEAGVESYLIHFRPKAPFMWQAAV